MTMNKQDFCCTPLEYMFKPKKSAENGVWGTRGDAQLCENGITVPEKKSSNFQVTIYPEQRKNI